jgi:hypothetical protein
MFALCLSTPGASRHPRQRGIRFAIPSRLREIHPRQRRNPPAGSLISPSGGGGPDEGGTGGGPAPAGKSLTSYLYQLPSPVSRLPSSIN